MAVGYMCFLLLTWTTSTLAHAIPVHSDDAPQEHHAAAYARPMIAPAPVFPVAVPSAYHRFYNYYGRPPTPVRPKPRSQLFQQPTNSGIFSGGSASTGLSYVNNLLSGVNKKIYGTPSSGFGFGSPGSVPFIPPASSYLGPVTSNAGTPLGTPAGTPTGNIGTGTGNFPGGFGGPATDIFGPGLRPVALDMPDPTDPGSTSGPGNGNAPPTGVIINNGPNQPPVSLTPGSSPTPVPTIPQPESGNLPNQTQQSDTWVWPDLVITGALPSVQLGAASQGGAQGNSQEPVAIDQQQEEPAQGISNFLQRGRQDQQDQQQQQQQQHLQEPVPGTEQLQSEPVQLVTQSAAEPLLAVSVSQSDPVPIQDVVQVVEQTTEPVQPIVLV